MILAIDKANNIPHVDAWTLTKPSYLVFFPATLGSVERPGCTPPYETGDLLSSIDGEDLYIFNTNKLEKEIAFCETPWSKKIPQSCKSTPTVLISAHAPLSLSNY